MARWTSIVSALVLCLGGCNALPEPPERSGEYVFFLVRHAEKVDSSDGSPLTEMGTRRAQTLAAILRDARIRQAYSTDFPRTRQTAAPLVESLGVEMVLYDGKDLPALASRLLSAPGRYLVVGHGNTTPELARLLGGEPGAEISSEEYDRLYVLTHRPGIGTTTILLRFEPQESEGKTTQSADHSLSGQTRGLAMISHAPSE